MYKPSFATQQLTVHVKKSLLFEIMAHFIELIKLTIDWQGGASGEQPALIPDVRSGLMECR